MQAEFVWKYDPLKMADQLTKGLKNKAIRIAMNKAAGRVKDAVCSNAPNRYGYLSKSMRIKVKNYKDKSIWVAIVGPKSDFVKAKGKRTRGPLKGTAINHRPSLYARLVERGTRHAGAKPYLAPALASTWGAFQDTLCAKLAEQVAQLLPRA